MELAVALSSSRNVTSGKNLNSAKGNLLGKIGKFCGKFAKI
jgi:hypothetical protein